MFLFSGHFVIHFFQDEELRDSRSDSEEDSLSESDQEEDMLSEDHLCLDKEAVKLDNVSKEGINGVIAHSDSDKVAQNVK